MAKGVSLDVVGGAEGTRWDGLGLHGTRRRERMIKRRVKRKTDAAGGGKLDS